MQRTGKSLKPDAYAYKIRQTTIKEDRSVAVTMEVLVEVEVVVSTGALLPSPSAT